MFRYSFIVILILLTSIGCANHTKQTLITQDEIEVFDNEKSDLLILEALFAMQNHEFKDAAKYFEDLYIMSDDKVYLTNAIKLSLSQNNATFSSKFVEEGYNKYKDDNDMKRFYVAQLIKEDKLEEGRKIIEELLKTERSEQNLKLMAAILTFENNFEKALKFYDEAYALNKSEQTLLQIIDINVKLNKIDKAILLLETSVRINGCTPNTCARLISLYSTQQNIDGILSTYLKAYEKFQDDESAKKIVEIYMYKNNMKSAISFLEKNEQNPNLLIDLYAYQKEFKKAKNLAQKMYQENGEIDYLAKVAIYTYEGSKTKKDVLHDVAKNFDIVVKKSDNAMYQNYYGYLLIDHDIDIPKGIELVKKALEKEPDSYYYLDSLAWGYYKLDRCNEALEVMQNVYNDNKEENEIVEHYNLIQKCVKKNKQ